MPPKTTVSSTAIGPPRGRSLRIVAGILLTLLSVGVWLARNGGSTNSLLSVFGLGPGHGLEIALFQSAPLRTNQGGIDRVYFVSTQTQTVILAARRGGADVRTDYLHIDLWAVDAATTAIAWRHRLRSFREREREGRILPGFEILGADGGTLWLNIEGPLGISLADGRVVADADRIGQRNPELAGRLVIEPGYIAFGRNGLQLTLDDASQWRIDASDLSAAPRDTPVSEPGGIVGPANPQPSSTSSFQTRALTVGDRWLGVLTDKEADHLRHLPVIPGRDPNERPGVMQQFLNENHVPSSLNDPLLQPYRLWSARIREVSAAPPDWPKDFPDNWGKRTEFSDYQRLPEAPSFLRAGLLRQHRGAAVPFWYRNPDSVLVLHLDRLGEAGRLQLSRVSGPAGKIVWQAPLPLVSLASVMRGEDDLLLWGSEPGVARAGGPRADPSHAKLTRIDVASGATLVLDMAAASLTRAVDKDTPPD